MDKNAATSYVCGLIIIIILTNELLKNSSWKDKFFMFVQKLEQFILRKIFVSEKSLQSLSVSVKSLRDFIESLESLKSLPKSLNVSVCLPETRI